MIPTELAITMIASATRGSRPIVSVRPINGGGGAAVVTYGNGSTEVLPNGSLTLAFSRSSGRAYGFIPTEKCGRVENHGDVGLITNISARLIAHREAFFGAGMATSIAQARAIGEKSVSADGLLARIEPVAMAA